MNYLRKFYNHSFIRYGIMAVTVVLIELATFWIFNEVFGWHYLVATWLSLFIGIVLNWIGSHYFVFGSSTYSKKREFTLVLLTSLFGVALQSIVVALTVELAEGPAIIGKIVAIVVTFFWNYFVRKKYIYGK